MMAADGIPFCEDFDQWRTRIEGTQNRNLAYAEDSKSLMEQSLQYIKQTDRLNAALHLARERLHDHFIAPSAQTRSDALEAINDFDTALDDAEPSQMAQSLLLDWFPKPRE